MPLAPSTRLGPYEIVAMIGAGGMGEVYRARDPRMGREVAIKVSSDCAKSSSSMCIGNLRLGARPNVLTPGTRLHPERQQLSNLTQ